MSLVETVFNHLVLPPKLPGGQESDDEDISHDLVKRLVKAVDSLREVVSSAHAEALLFLRKSLVACGELNQGRLDKASLIDAFSNLEKHALFLHVVEQNAALIIHDGAKSVVFEAFEASPASEDVLASENALLWAFPGRAAEVPLDTFLALDFQESLADFLEQASMETLNRFAAKATKANATITEIRDTTDCSLITQMLMPQLETLGGSFQVPKLRKRVRDEANIDVNGAKGALLPWRRHPLWLILRVATQRQLYLHLGETDGRVCYKVLIATVLAQLLIECQGQLRPESTLALQAKLCRRLAKLEMEKTIHGDCVNVYDDWLEPKRAWFRDAIEAASKQISLVWENFKSRTTRKVERLPAYADPADFRLALRSSRTHLVERLQWRPATQTHIKSLGCPSIQDEGIKQVRKFTRQYFDLEDLEKGIQKDVKRLLKDDVLHDDLQMRCVELANYIYNYFSKANDAYSANPEKMSSFILNIFDLWVALDILAVRQCPLLGHYHPIFTPSLLDALQLPNVHDLDRLQVIQQHLQQRIEKCRFQTCDIFTASDSSHCFSSQWVAKSSKLQSLQAEIEHDSKQARARKLHEWTEKDDKCEALVARMASLSCVCTQMVADDGKLVRDVRGCTKCWCARTRKRERIEAHEDFLPRNDIEKSALVFELDLPRWFEAYRNVTWKIIRDLAHPSKTKPANPPLVLRDFKQLQPYTKPRTTTPGCITLASAAKSYLQTHYKNLKVISSSVNDAILNFAPRFKFYDQEHSIWVTDLDRQALTFQHLCGIFVPRCLNQVLPPVAQPPAVVDGPSSYQVIANQRECPQQASLHEFSAYQSLIFGKSQRWITILRELGSANLNFSGADTTRMLSELSVQAGPTNKGQKLREAFMVFNDKNFCQRLVKQIRSRLDGIKSNYREGNCMDLLITLAERLYSFSSGSARQSAQELIISAREATLQWISRLRKETGIAEDAATAERAARYAFTSALLCRRTFALISGPLTEEELRIYCEASIALQENIAGDFELVPAMKSMVIRDTKMAWGIQQFVKTSLNNHPQSLDAAICCGWGMSENKPKFSTWVSAEGNWVATYITTKTQNFSFKQTVHFDYVEGFLLVDGKPLGRLPHKIRTSAPVKELFGDQHLRTFASKHSDMTHKLVMGMENSEIHFGIRNDEVIIRAESPRGILEFVPRDVFRQGGISDLPTHLVEGCVHWLNLSKYSVEIRRQASIWKTRRKDWVIDLRTHECKRRSGSNIYRLVDPHSKIGLRVAKIFENFTRPERLTIYQPEKSRLCVELNQFELTFKVNHSKLLECHQLRAEIDEDQDAKTLYGLQSKIVLRDTDNWRKRSVIVPLVKPSYRKAGPHVEVITVDDVNSSLVYGRYGIDEIVGRLTCPPEPPLVYAKAHLHALTSFASIPDPLTGRTGTEEAVHILQSGIAQPWRSLGLAIRRLDWIADLSPVREFYPKDKRKLQKVSWDPHLPVAVQHERFEALARELVRKSHRLQPFFENAAEVKEVEPVSHLRRRGETRRSVYEPSTLHPKGESRTVDTVYHSRDHEENSQNALNVIRVAEVTLRWPFRLTAKKDLRSLLQGEKVIGGFDGSLASPVGLKRLVEDGIAQQFGELVNFARRTKPNAICTLAFRLALLAFQNGANMDMLEILAAFARIDALKVIIPPQHPSFIGFDSDAGAPAIESLEALIRPLWPDFQPSQRGDTEGARRKHFAKCLKYTRRLSEWLVGQWPVAEPPFDDFAPNDSLIDRTTVWEAVLPTWQRMLQNRELSKYIDMVQGVLEKFVVKEKTVPKRSSQPSQNPPTTHYASITRGGPVIPSLSNDLLSKCGPSASSGLVLPPLPCQLVEERELTKLNTTHSMAMREHGELRRILDHFTSSTDELRKSYGEDLKQSLQALNTGRSCSSSSYVVSLREGSRTIVDIDQHINVVRRKIKEQFEDITAALAHKDCRSEWLQLANLWPGTTKVTLLEQLRSSARVTFGTGMKKALVGLGVLITTLQFLSQVLHTMSKKDDASLQQTLANVGHQNWSPMDFPDWLLMEIDCNLLIRPKQVDVAHAIISPASGSNSVLQLNMGEGKTSCIVPMVIAVLADRKQLARLIVPKALLVQTAQTVQSRLGGLAGRAVRHIPFSRRTTSNLDMLRLYNALHKEMRQGCGVILTTPDHLLSFKLSGLQRLVDSKTEEAQFMIGLQEELTKFSRDVIGTIIPFLMAHFEVAIAYKESWLDESDFTLAVKTQLSYPSGPQIHVDGAPHRWEVVQHLLLLMADHLPAIRSKFPRGVEIVRLQNEQGFPMAHFLHQGAEDELHRLIIDDICNGRTPFLRLSDETTSSSDLREHIRQLLREASKRRLNNDELNIFSDQDSAHKILLLISGLLANRIILLCLKKRWNVHYGLSQSRDPIAVPYEAKGIPSEQAEFGHPDVSIILTVLSFYYAGLTPAQFRQSLEQVLKSDDPASEFDQWTNASDTLPETLRHWNVINADDAGQTEELFNHLRLDRNVLNHFMNNFVFPLHAKQFGLKLASSAWDIPLVQVPKPCKSIAGRMGARTTGFSGTNDNKMLLPLTIQQDDLPSLAQTNAEVLTYLLQVRKREYRIAAKAGKRMTEVELLHGMKNRRIRILIDAGAYILEMGTETLAKKWLEIEEDAKAAVYFKQGTPWVLYKGSKDRKLPLIATAFADNLSECVIFLDEAHTRGVDMKLPPGARGALTLALGQTKDHTVQAAMRLRQLATTQSVTFFAPPEVDQSIRDVCKLPSRDLVNSSHVVTWLLEQTCRANEQLQNLHLAQGFDFCRRMNAQWSNPKLISNKTQRSAVLSVIQQQERQNLEQQYGPVTDTSPTGSEKEVSFPILKGFMNTLTQQRKSVAHKLNGKGLHSSVLEEVEQEREVEFQVEEVRQVEKPKRYEALKFARNPVIENFVRTGRLVGSAGYVHAFASLRNTSIGQKFGVHETGSRFFVSEEFTRTVVLRKKAQTADNFLRPVEWILWSPSTETALIIIPEEAELLIPLIRRSGQTSLVHLIAYAAPVTKSMLHFNQLSYYTMPAFRAGYKVPEWFQIELGIFAGRLYVSYDQCAAIAQYLQQSAAEDDSVLVNNRSFARNPNGFLLEWLALRRQVQDICQTPMGYICQGRRLHAEHPFFITRANDASDCVGMPVSNSNSENVSDDEDEHDDDDDDDDEDGSSDGGEDWYDVGEDIGDDVRSDTGEYSKAENFEEI